MAASARQRASITAFRAALRIEIQTAKDLIQAEAINQLRDDLGKISAQVAKELRIKTKEEVLRSLGVDPQKYLRDERMPISALGAGAPDPNLPAPAPQSRAK